ncbi:chromophore lyase CpcT/CpeT [Anabaena subtropica]|uniref:Chromophore lyase CpcT/CpeT n=1 Tax=Anabaena subtropica FACHB-260 TaxID=2692884 RepID=A0ABR8CTZ5_9NOST|nr:chromophore lyase CpcT/CpeT [Anabaena subtropica]MBD2345965.1 chromophore lyase CpcT/CpeT [Anabaena subtropica FACHB-260]
MDFSPDLLTLGKYLTGEFDNREQALAEPVWFVHLRLWQRPVDLFPDDSITLFAEQANIVNLDRPYRQRIFRLMPNPNSETGLYVQYYMPKNPSALTGAGRNPDLLKTLTPDQLELLPGCILSVSQQTVASNRYQFTASPLPDTRCTFTYLGNTVQVSLGFEVTETELYTYDKGIDQETGKATWGAITGPYRYTKREQY